MIITTIIINNNNNHDDDDDDESKPATLIHRLNKIFKSNLYWIHNEGSQGQLLFI